MSNLRGLTARQHEIVQNLNENGFVSTTELAESLSVSDMTIRRDTRELSRRGIVRIVHGGLMLPHGTIHTAGFAQRASESAEAKRRVAIACRALISERDVIIIDAGTTSFEVAHRLPESFEGTIVTHSAPVIQHSLRSHRRGTICLGGQLLLDSQAFIGELTVANLKGLRARTAFIGASGVDSHGIYIDRDLELPTKRAIMDAADRVVLVVTKDKLNESALVYLSGFDAIDTIVTDAPMPANLTVSAEEADVQIIVADGQARVDEQEVD